MSIEIRAWAEADRGALRALVSDASLAEHFDQFQGERGFDSKLHDPRLFRAGLRLATCDGEPAGFGLAWWLPQDEGVWVMTRVGVVGRFRRRGIGTRLARALVAAADASGARPDVSGSAWYPDPAGEALAARLGFAHERWFWLMTRPRGGAPEPVWPADIELRTFDGSDRAIADWIAAYEDSFADHFRHVRSTAEDGRRMASDPGFRADGLALAYRGAECVGFCRNALFERRGEIGVLGVVRAARGIGLGRALLRWGVRWLEANGPGPVTLLVDGANESALALYRSEGFEVTRTRRIWGRPREASA
ncbi:MAG TPA: GNAT family N-acetyltransferase [Candidatus Acidoferrales bacterium]|nr:GNAT family N-acetyltransferase [Candidatus Acidoferrales bacterium]